MRRSVGLREVYCFCIAVLKSDSVKPETPDEGEQGTGDSENPEEKPDSVIQQPENSSGNEDHDSTIQKIKIRKINKNPFQNFKRKGFLLITLYLLCVRSRRDCC